MHSLLKLPIQVQHRVAGQRRLSVAADQQLDLEQQLQHLLHVVLLLARVLRQLLNGQRSLLVELQQHGHLESARLQRVPLVEVVGRQLPAAVVVQPV